MAIVVNLDELLYARRMTLTELADRVGITLANLSILKTGKAKAIRFSTLDAICRQLGVHVLAEHVRAVGDQIDAMRMDRARLHALLAEEFSRLADRLERIARSDLGRHLLEAGQRDFLPEALHHVGRPADADRRADLRGVAAVTGRDFHVDDVALLQHASRRARIAEHQRGLLHRGRADDEEIDVTAALEDCGAGRRAQLIFGDAGPRARHHRVHGVLA